MVLMENLGGKEIRDLKDKRDKKGREVWSQLRALGPDKL